MTKAIVPLDASSNYGFETGSFTGTFTGFTTSPTRTVEFTKLGNIVVMVITGSPLTATSNSTGLGMTGVPASIQPSTFQRFLQPTEDSGADQIGSAVLTSGTIAFVKDHEGNFLFTASGAKGLPAINVAYVYKLD